MTEHKILEWHGIILGTKTSPNPFFYIKADKTLEKLQNKKIKVVVQGSKSDYDGTLFSAFISSSAFLPSYRPYFYNKEKYFTVILETSWSGYPEFSGWAFIWPEDAPQLSKAEAPKPFSPPCPIPWPSGTNSLVFSGMYGPEYRTTKI